MNTYIFHISIPGTGRIWRKIELPASSTLEELHLAIQRAFAFDNDHLYSFFMSGKAWDPSSEYTLPAADEPFELEEDDDLDSPADLAAMQAFQESLGGAPLPQSIPDVIKLVGGIPELRSQMAQLMSEQLGMPASMIDSMLLEASVYLTTMPDDILDVMLAREGAVSDVRTTTLESLGLRLGQTFLYLFDYGDEWRFRVKVHQIGEANVGVQYPRIVEAVGEAPEQYPDWDEEEEEDDEGWAG